MDRTFIKRLFSDFIFIFLIFFQGMSIIPPLHHSMVQIVVAAKDYYYL